MITDQKYIFLILIHIGIAVLSILSNTAAMLYFLAALAYFIIKIILSREENKSYNILLACAYFTGAEVFFRITKGGLSYEASKYLVILFVLIGMFYKGLSGKGYPYFIYLILLVPAVVVASITLSFDANFRTNIAFVLSGPVCLGIASLYCYDRKITHKQLLDVLLYIALPSITTAAYLFLYSPSIKDTLSGTASNLAASGGFGPNQVSTALGLGMFTIAVRIFMASPRLTMQVVNIIILGALTFRAFVTFSRGGVIAAALVIIAFLTTYFFRSTLKRKNQIITTLIFLFIGLSVTWIVSSNQTRGLLDKRYANQDALGREKQDITTGRVELFMEELEGFLNNPFFGIGASRVKDIRVEREGRHLPSHNEIGRLLSEHGFLGLVIILILIIKPLDYRSRNKKNYFFYAFMAFWFATINHSGMRIAAPSFLYALALLNVIHEKAPIHRKQLKKQEL